MSYCKGNSIEIARGKALKLLIIDKKPISIVADRFGVHRSTVWRWHKKWRQQNQYAQLTNNNRPNVELGKVFRWQNIKWNIPTLSSAPIHPKRLDNDIVQIVLAVKKQLNRCAEVIWHYVNTVLSIKISLSSVRRILKSHHQVNKTKWHKNRHYKGIKRPLVLSPGDLVEVDTIHLFNPISKQKRYIYTVIDLYTRMSYAKVYEELKPLHSVDTILEAKAYFNFNFKMVQSDNGLEFSNYFRARLEKQGIQIRHTRLGRPNDNAHIERFNRTIQEECTGSYYLESESISEMNSKIQHYIDHYNHNRIHLGLGYRTPSQMLQRF